MTKDNKKDLFVGLILSFMVVVSTILIFQKKFSDDSKGFVSIDMNTPNIIYNMQVDKAIDTILVVGLRAYDLKDTKIFVRYITPEQRQAFSQQGMTLNAYTLGGKENSYLITLIKTDTDQTISLIAHELAHVKQLADKRIIIDETQLKITWLGKDISKNIPAYNDRPWEIEAFKKEAEMSAIMKKILYGN